MGKFSWEYFLTGEVAVIFDSHEDKMHFLRECVRRGIRWIPPEPILATDYVPASHVLYLPDTGRICCNYCEKFVTYNRNDYIIELI